MTDEIPDLIPDLVRAKVLSYREAMMIARNAYERQRDAAHRGDTGTVDLLEKGRQDRVMAIDRARRELDEQIRAWGAP